MTQTIDNILGETVNYTYDYLHRLTGATATNSVWGESYSYDGFGNLTAKTPTVGSAPSFSGSAGSNAQNGSLPGQWDVENRPMTQGSTFYVYDPWGRRIWKQWTGQTGANECEAYFYGATGQKLESYSCEYTPNTIDWFTTLEGINTYFGGKMLSEKGVAVLTDRLGSVRANSNGESFSYFPWGEERGTGTADGRTKFAGYYRDQPGQDYANARYYSATTASFWSPDPGSIHTADSGTPNSWNRYPYAGGDPVNHIDPSGLELMLITGNCVLDGQSVGCSQLCDPTGNLSDAYAPLYGDQPSPCDAAPGGSSGDEPVAPPAATAPPDCKQSFLNALNLDYSQKLYNKGTQTTQDHIIQRHGGKITGNPIPGVSQYYASTFAQIRNLNFFTFLFGAEAYDPDRNVFTFTWSAFQVTPGGNHLGTDPLGDETSVNRLVLKADCKTVITSYPVPGID